MGLERDAQGLAGLVWGSGGSGLGLWGREGPTKRKRMKKIGWTANVGPVEQEKASPPSLLYPPRFGVW